MKSIDWSVIQVVLTRGYWLWVTVLLVLLGFIVFQMDVSDLLHGQQPLLDFDAYFQMTREINEGVSPYAVSTMQTAGPPLVILPYVITLWFSIEEARVGMTILSLIASGIASWLLASRMSSHFRLILFLLVLLGIWLSFPARFTLLMGQSNLIVMLCATVVLTQKGWWQSVSLSLMITLKTNYALLWLFFWQKPKVLISSFLIVIALAMLGIAFISLADYQQFFFDRFLGLMQGSQLPVGMDYYNQSLQSTLARLDLSSMYPLVAVLLAMLMMFSVWKCNNPGFGLVFSILLSPIIWQHYLIVLYPVIVLFGWQNKDKPWVVVGCVASYLLMMTNWHWLHTLDPNWLTGLMGSHQFFGVGLLLALMFSHELGNSRVNCERV